MVPEVPVKPVSPGIQFAPGEVCSPSEIWIDGCLELPWPGIIPPPPGADDGGVGGMPENVLRCYERGPGVVPPNFWRFCTRVYESMSAQSSTTAYPAICYWFGHIIEVLPTGRWHILGEAETVNAFYVWIREHAKTNTFDVLDCGAGPETGTCHYDRYGPGIVTPGVSQLSWWILGAIALIGAAAFVFTRGK